MKVLYNRHKNIKEEAFVVEPVIVRVTKFNEDGYDKFRKQMSDAHNTGQTVIPVVIDSYGGEAYSLNGNDINNTEFKVPCGNNHRVQSNVVWGNPFYFWISRNEIYVTNGNGNDS